MRILIVEDDKSLNEALYKLLSSEHYGVDRCYDGLDAKHHISVTPYDAVVLDIMLPNLDGLTLLQQLRQEGNGVPVLLLTARDSVEDRVKGLDAGANDYLVKPFAGAELLARIRVLIRQQSKSLTNRLQVILEYLMRNQGIVLSRQRIEDHIWNYDYEGGSNVVDVYIRKLRKLVDEGQEKKLIHTVRNVGYVIREQP